MSYTNDGYLEFKKKRKKDGKVGISIMFGLELNHMRGHV